MTAEEVKEYEDSSANRYGGIGVVIRNGEEGVTVAKVYARSAAGEAGIREGSRFLAVGGEPTDGLGVNELAEMISAAIRTGTVELTLLCPDGEERGYSLTPGEVLTEPVSARMMEGLGYIRIENFEDRSADEAIRAVEEFRAQGVGGLIFDVRTNPGGHLTHLLKLLDHLLPEGTLFIARYYDGAEETEVSGPECVSLPMAVLVNEDTYSAAEFFAAALREYGWATLVGAPTTGKGRAQVTVPMEDGSAIHISYCNYFTPLGNSLDGVGLTPDLEVPVTEEERGDFYYGLLDPGEDRQLQAAVQLLAGIPAVSP
jgi:carboxyl-terminal processing protease